MVRLLQSLHRRWQLSLPGSDFQRKSRISSHSWRVPYPNLPRLRLLKSFGLLWILFLFLSPLVIFHFQIIAKWCSGWWTWRALFISSLLTDLRHNACSGTHDIDRVDLKFTQSELLSVFICGKNCYMGWQFFKANLSLTISDPEKDTAFWTLDH